MLEAEHLVKRYGDQTAVKDLSFHLTENRVYGLLGPNGAGKSTTMNMITGYISPTSGKIRVCGFDPEEEPEKARKCIGYLPEIPPLYPDMTIEEYLLTAAELKKVPKSARKASVEDAMERVFISERRDRLIRNLSKGYKQRVGIAQTLLGDPKIIILDEPTVGLDPRQVLEIRDLVKGLGKNHTVIVSSHILTEISEVCDHVMIMNRGELIASGNAAELEKMVQGQNRLNLLAEGQEETLRSAFSSFPEILAVHMEPEKNGPDAYRIELRLENGTDIRRNLFYEMAEKHCAILEMTQSQLSLEEIFLELVEKPA